MTRSGLAPEDDEEDEDDAGDSGKGMTLSTGDSALGVDLDRDGGVECSVCAIEVGQFMSRGQFV